MDVDQLKSEWQALDQKVQSVLRLNARVVEDAVVTRTRSYVGREYRRMVPSLLLDVGAMVLLGSFIGDHWGEPRFSIPAIALHLFVLGFTIATSRQWALLHAIDHGAAVIANQRRLERLKLERVWMTKWVILLAPLLWTPLFIVLCKGLLHVDAYRAFGMRYIVANLLVGVAAIPILWWGARRFGERFRDRPFVQRLCDDIGGRNLKAATAYLASLAAFEEES
jgi:hypothetical protein